LLNLTLVSEVSVPDFR